MPSPQLHPLHQDRQPSDVCVLGTALWANRLMALRGKLAAIPAFMVDGETGAAILDAIDGLDDELVLLERASQFVTPSADYLAEWTARFAEAGVC